MTEPVGLVVLREPPESGRPIYEATLAESSDPEWIATHAGLIAFGAKGRRATRTTSPASS